MPSEFRKARFSEWICCQIDMLVIISLKALLVQEMSNGRSGYSEYRYELGLLLYNTETCKLLKRDSQNSWKTKRLRKQLGFDYGIRQFLLKSSLAASINHQDFKEFLVTDVAFRVLDFNLDFAERKSFRFLLGSSCQPWHPPYYQSNSV